MTTVAVGVPVWNGERYLETCIAGLLDQSRPPDEIVIADNASTDATARIADGLAATEPTVRAIHQPRNLGAAGNFNDLFTRCDADLFAWCPHDDVWSPDLLGQLVTAHTGPGVAVAYGAAHYIDEHGEPAGRPEPAIWSDAAEPTTRLRELLADPVRSHLHVCNPVLGLMRADLLAGTGLIRPYGGSDKVLIVEMALRGRLVPVEAPFFRRAHPGSSVRVNPDAESRRRWFDPDASGVATPELTLLAGFLDAVRRAPVSPSDRLRAAGTVLAWAGRGRRPRVLAGEMRRSAGSAARRGIGRISRPERP